MICSLKLGSPGKPVVCSFIPKPKDWEPGALMFEGRRRMSQLRQRANLSFICFLFYSGPQSTGWCSQDWWGQPSLLSLPIQMLISSRNSLTDTARNSILPAIWASLSPVKLTYEQPPQLVWSKNSKKNYLHRNYIQMNTAAIFFFYIEV